jgi:hypothetical protein
VIARGAGARTKYVNSTQYFSPNMNAEFGRERERSEAAVGVNFYEMLVKS